jgi:hypothetical protein
MPAEYTGHTVGFRVAVKADVLHAKVRNALGQFQQMNQQIVPAHEKMARGVAEAIAAELMRRVIETGRAQRSGREQRLADVIRAPGNRRAGKDGWQVMVTSFLDQSAAGPYWRNLETGTETFVGDIFPGFFRSAGGRRLGPSGAHVDPILINLHASFHVEGHPPYRPQRGEARLRGEVRVRGESGKGGGARGAIPTPAGEMVSRGRGEGRGEGPLQGAARLTPAGSNRPVWQIIIRRPIRPYQYIEVGGRGWLDARAWEPILTEALKLHELRALGLAARLGGKRV